MRKSPVVKRISTFLLLALLLTACGSGSTSDTTAAANGAQGSTGETSVEEPGTGEPRTLVIYASATPDLSDPLDRGFEEAYLAETGEEIVVETRHAQDGGVDALIDLEAQSGDVQADVLEATGAQLVAINEEHDLLDPVAFSFTDDPAIPESIREIAAETGFTPKSINPYVIAFNTDHVAEEDVPQSWLDLHDERWTGVVGMGDPETADGAHVSIWFLSKYLAETLGPPFGWEWFENFGQVNPTLTSGHGLLSELVASGELHAGIMGISPAATAAMDGHPVGIAIPEEGIAANVSHVAVVKDRPNEDLAMAYIEWLVSQEGQTIMKTPSHYVAIRTDVTYEDAPIPIDVDLATVASVDSQWVAEQGPANIERFGEAINGG